MKKQIGLNWRHAEVPWNYVAVKKFDEYFDKSDGNDYMATLLNPFIIDIFGHHNYHYLPLSVYQEFSVDVKNIMQYFYQGDLGDYYEGLLKQGNKVYYSDYYINNNLKYYGLSIEAVKKRFLITKVFDGCENSCNIYQLSLKK
jgi:hypothetical protein